MANKKFSLNLNKFNNVVVKEVEGKFSKKMCICIPIEDNRLFKSDSGYHADFVAWECDNDKFGSTHFIKRSVPAEEFKSMSAEDRKMLPIFGNVRNIGSAGVQKHDSSNKRSNRIEDDDNLPF